MHLATAGEGPCFTNDDYTRLKMHIPTGTECPQDRRNFVTLDGC